jgi:hypothetical protein
MSYDLKPVEVPALRGRPLRALAWLLDGPLGGPIARSLLRQGGIDRIAGWRLDEAPTMLPIAPALPGEGGAPTSGAATGGAPTGAAAGGEAGRLGRAYRDGTTTPTAIAEAFLAARAELDGGATPLAIFVAVDADDVRSQAAASTARFVAGAPLGPLDGVPIAIKDELDQRGYPTRVGTSSSTTARRPPTRRSSPGCARPVRSWSARRTCTRSGSTRPAATSTSASAATRTIRPTIPAAARAARPPRSPPGWCRSRSAPTAAARSGSRRRCAARSGSRRRSAG